MKRLFSTFGIIFILPLFLLGSTGSDPFATGVRLFNQGSYKQSIELLSEAVAAKPSDPVRRITYGVALANSRHYDDAIIQFKEASKLAPDDPTADFLLEGAYQGIGMVTEASKHKSAAGKRLKMGVDTKPQQALQMPAPCSKLLDRALSENPENAIAHNLFGDLCQVQGRYEEAVAHYKRATELAPGWVKPWFNLGMANLVIKPADAATDFRRVLALDPKNLQAQMWLGDALAAQKDYPEAIQAYDKAATSPSLAPQARSRLGNVYLKQNQLPQAEDQFNQAVKVQPSNVQANAGLGDVYRQQKRLDDSTKQYQRASELTPQAPTQQMILSNNIAINYIDKGDCQRAIDELRKVVSASGTGQADGVQMLLGAYRRCGMLGQGIVEYENALKKRPNDITAMRFLVAAYAETGNTRGRMEMARRLLKSRPAETPTWSKELGIALVAMGDRSGALGAWKKGLDASPAKDAAGILKAATNAGQIEELHKHYAEASNVRKAPTPTLVLALICETIGDAKGEVQARKKLTALYPGNQQYWIWLGDAERRAGNIDGARASFKHASDMDQDVTLRAIATDRLKELPQLK